MAHIESTIWLKNRWDKKRWTYGGNNYNIPFIGTTNENDDNNNREKYSKYVVGRWREENTM